MRNIIKKIKSRVTRWGKEYAQPACKKTFRWIKHKVLFACRILLPLVASAAFIAFFSIPFMGALIDLKLAQWIWYPALTIYMVMFIIFSFFSKDPVFNVPVFDSLGKISHLLLVPTVISIFVFTFYDIDYIWMWVVFGIAALVLPLYSLCLLSFDYSQHNYTAEEKKISVRNTCSNILQYWLYDLLYMSIFNHWRPCTYFFGLITLVLIFYKLAKAFLDGTKILQKFLPFDLLLGIGLTVYLIYIIPNERLQEIILTIAASVLGGLLALVGVAWTIKHSNAARQEDLQRMEEERREEERKKHIPYVRISSAREVAPVFVDAYIRQGLDLGRPGDRALLEDKSYYALMINDFTIKNVSNANIILNGVIVHERYYEFRQSEILEPGVRCQIRTTGNTSIAMPKLEQSISLVINDILGNIYEIVCPVTLERDSFKMRITQNIDEVEYRGYSSVYSIISANLPTPIDVPPKS